MTSPRLATTARALLVALATASALTACDSGDGRALRPPPPGATAPPLPTSTTSTTAGAVIGPPVGSEEQPPLGLSSPDLPVGSSIPSRFTCDGDDVSPPLRWQGVPAGTVELAVVVRDPDAPGGEFLHWVVVGIDPSVTALGAGGLPETAVEVRPWTGPCPPPGETHDYVFQLYALAAASGITRDHDPGAAVATIESTQVASASLSAPYGRPAG